MVGNLPGKRVPELTFVFFLHILEEICVVGRGVFIPARLIPKVHIVWMSKDQGHSTLFDNPVEFSFPNIDVFLFQNYKKGEILRQGVWKLDKTSPAPVVHIEWEDGADAS